MNSKAAKIFPLIPSCFWNQKHKCLPLQSLEKPVFTMRIKQRKQATGQKFMLRGRHKTRVAEITDLYEDQAFKQSFLIFETHEKNLPT